MLTSPILSDGHQQVPVPSGTGKNVALHGLRGLSILMVLTWHLFDNGVILQFLTTGGTFRQIMYIGARGVDIFFMISGFLIFSSLIRSKSVRRFLVNRSIRILPVYWFLHALVFVGGGAVGYKRVVSDDLASGLWLFVSNLLLLPGIFGLRIIQIVSWSLSYEVFFYVLMSAAFIAWRRRARRGSLGFAGLVLLSAGIIVHYHPRFWFFLVGILSYWLIGRTKGAIIGSIWGELEDIAAFALFLATLYVDHLILTLVAGLWFFVSVTRGHGVVARLLGQPVFQYVGDISYSFYLWHTIAIYICNQALATRLAHHGPLEYVLGVAVPSVVLGFSLSHVSYRLLEVRLANWIRSRFLAGNSQHVVQA